MYNPFKRTKITQHSLTPPPPMPPLQHHRLSTEDELSVMVAALTNVVSGSSSATATATANQQFHGYPWQPSPPPPTFDGAAAASTSSTTSTGTDCTDTFLPPSSELDTCHECNIDGCLGCNFFPPPPTQQNTTTDHHRQHQQEKKIVVSSGSGLLLNCGSHQPKDLEEQIIWYKLLVLQYVAGRC